MVERRIEPTNLPTTPPITDPANSIENAFAMFTAAIRFYEACANRRFDCQWFGNHRVYVYTGDGSDLNEQPGITVQPELYSYEKLTTQACNLIYAAMGSMASAVYEAAANDAGLRDLNKSSEKYNDTEKIIEIIFQIRNGFAHRPHSPNWHVNKARQNRYSFTVEGIKIDIDFAALNGRGLIPEHFGGYEGFVAMCRNLHSAVTAALGVK